MQQRQSTMTKVGRFTVGATSLSPSLSPNAVSIEIGSVYDAYITTWLSSDDARALATALIASADHYDAETARLAAEEAKAVRS